MATVQTFQAMEIFDGLRRIVQRMDERVTEERAIADGVRLVRGRFRPEMKDEAEARLRRAWATLKGENR